jgi:hypothetical protein
MDQDRRRRFIEWFAATYGDDDAEARAKFMADSAKHGRSLPLTKGRVTQLFDPDEPFGERAARNLADRFGLEENFFLLNQGHKVSEPSVLYALPHRRRRSRDEVEIEHFDTGGAMGHGVVLKDQPGVIQSWRVTPEWVQKNVRGYSSTDNLTIVTGFGDSMRPMYNPGDPLIVDVGVRSVDFDGIYFFRVGDEGFIKRLQRIPGEGVVAISENKAYRDWTIKGSMDFEIFGRVLKVWRGEDF